MSGANKRLKHASRMVFEWKDGAAIQGMSKVKPQLVGETLEKIEARHGALRPGYLVDEARPAASPLHPLFEWDDADAAEKYRLWQARKVIGSVVVSRIDNREVQKPISAFASILQESGRSYISMVTAMDNAGQREAILRNAKADLVHWRNKYQALQEFSEMFAVIDRVIETVDETV